MSCNGDQMTHELLIPGQLSLAQLRRLCSSTLPVKLDAACRKGIRANAELVQTSKARDTGVIRGEERYAGTELHFRIALFVLNDHDAGTVPDAVEELLR